MKKSVIEKIISKIQKNSYSFPEGWDREFIRRKDATIERIESQVDEDEERRLELEEIENRFWSQGGNKSFMGFFYGKGFDSIDRNDGKVKRSSITVQSNVMKVLNNNLEKTEIKYAYPEPEIITPDEIKIAFISYIALWIYLKEGEQGLINFKPYQNLPPYSKCDADKLMMDLSELCARCPIRKEVSTYLDKQIIVQIREFFEVLPIEKFKEWVSDEIDNAQKAMQEINIKSNVPGTYMSVASLIYIQNKERVKALNKAIQEIPVSDKSSVNEGNRGPVKGNSQKQNDSSLFTDLFRKTGDGKNETYNRFIQLLEGKSLVKIVSETVTWTGENEDEFIGCFVALSELEINGRLFLRKKLTAGRMEKIIRPAFEIEENKWSGGKFRQPKRYSDGVKKEIKKWTEFLGERLNS